MCQSPALLRAIASDRAADLRRTSDTAREHRDVPKVAAIQAARRATGWALVDLGLRLALPPGAMKAPRGTATR